MCTRNENRCNNFLNVCIFCKIKTRFSKIDNDMSSFCWGEVARFSVSEAIQ